MDKNRNAKPAEDQGVIVAGTDARARARGEVKDDGKPREVRDAPTENPPTGDESKGLPISSVADASGTDDEAPAVAQQTDP